MLKFVWWDNIYLYSISTFMTRKIMQIYYKGIFAFYHFAKKIAKKGVGLL